MKVRYLLMGWLLSTLPAISAAHTLTQTSSQLVIHHDSAELTVLVDIDNWLLTLRDPQAWLLGDSETLLSESQLSSGRLHHDLYKLLEREIKLTIDGQHVPIAPIKNTQLPRDHVVEFRFSATHTSHLPQQVGIRFPKSLGDVEFVISKPVYSKLSAGSANSFPMH